MWYQKSAGNGQCHSPPPPPGDAQLFSKTLPLPPRRRRADALERDDPPAVAQRTSVEHAVSIAWTE